MKNEAYEISRLQSHFVYFVFCSMMVGCQLDCEESKSLISHLLDIIISCANKIVFANVKNALGLGQSKGKHRSKTFRVN